MKKNHDAALKVDESSARYIVARSVDDVIATLPQRKV